MKIYEEEMVDSDQATNAIYLMKPKNKIQKPKVNDVLGSMVARIPLLRKLKKQCDKLKK